MATTVFEGIKFFKKILKKDHGRNISVKFHQNWMGSFQEDIYNKRNHKNGRTRARLTPSHDINTLAYGQWSKNAINNHYCLLSLQCFSI